MKTKFLTLIFLLNSALVLGGFLWTFFRLQGIRQPLILHFTTFRDTGITQRGTLGDLAFFAALFFVALILNFLLAFGLKERDFFLSRLIVIATVVFALLIFVGFKVIISVNSL